jgi:hypothetical protein
MKALSWGAGAVSVAIVAAALAGAAGISAADTAGDSHSLVEDYSYPSADQILKDHQLQLIGGDGHILFVTSHKYSEGQCAVGEVQVEKNLTADPWGYYYCFKTVGANGLLTLSVPATIGVRGGDKPVKATAELPTGTKKTYEVPANQSVAIDPGHGSDPPKAMLVELRFGAA